MKKDSLWPAVTFLVLYTGLLFAGFSWMLKAEVKPIKEILTNHITDTNKKIEDTRRELVSLRKDTNEQIKETREELVNLRKDTNEQFSRLYELLIQDRKQKQAKQ